MKTHLLRSATCANISKRLALTCLAIVSFTLPFQPAIGADNVPDPGARPLHFEFGGQIKDAVNALAGKLAMTNSQRAQLTDLMEQRMKTIDQQSAVARESLRNKVDLLLSDAQRKKVVWPDAHSWNWESKVSDFGTKIPDLTTEQKKEFKVLWRQYGAATWSVFIGAQKTYEEGLISILTTVQRPKLAAIVAEDSITHVANNQGQGSD